ncbi:UDP-glucose:glycoprotein glucosyltransferase 2 [Microtus ochrogaster]|uniref:UDP-glucose:glycoprotein glucosyltransferase 1 n=1 Tax=Microtus ochrogaster TaxID=79684 RepID=A0A8J6GUT2_MICOH|nr:UDP-glucose:glycoprotein glucosyltransferase 2 [Microtus ochrogaster]
MARARASEQLLLSSVALWLAFLGASPAAASKAVTAHLAAKWPETPLLLEASEFMAEESNERFWQFVETVRELAVYKQTESDYSYYNLILKKAGQFLDNIHINLLKFAFSLRAYSPTVQMFQQVAAAEPPPDGCAAFVVVHGKHTCKISEIKKLLSKATSRPRPFLFERDHKFPTGNESLPVIILYAEIGTREFAEFHRVLSKKSKNGKILYVLRHYIKKPSSRKMLLSGYGVELAIKDTEYKALDDIQVKTVSDATIEQTDADEVQGFLFGKLKEIYSNLKDNLTVFQKYLIKSSKAMMPLKVWELQDLSFQAASQIMSTPVYDAINLMKDIAQNFPIKARIGFVFILNTENEVDGTADAGVALWRAFNYIEERHGTSEAFTSMIHMFQKVKGHRVLTVDDVKSVLQNKCPNADILDILGTHSKYDRRRAAGTSFYNMTGLGPLPQALYNGEPFDLKEMSPEDLRGAVLEKMTDAFVSLQRDVFMGTLNDEINAVDFLMDKNNVVPRLNSLILHTKPRYLNLLSSSVTADIEDFSTFSFLDSQDKSAVIAKSLHYLTQEDNVLSAVTLWIVADFDVPSGRKLLFSALEHMEMDNNAFEKKYNTIGVNIFRTHQLFCQDVLKLQPGEIGIVSNGKFFGPLHEDLYLEDFHLIEKITFSNLVEKIKDIVENMEIDSKDMSDLVMKIDALVSPLPVRASRYDVTLLKENHSVIKLSPPEKDLFYDIVAIVDPLTRGAQKMAQLLVVLGKIVNARMKLFMNCRSKLSEAPIGSFYRFVLEPELISGANNGPSHGPVAKFLDIPESHLLTLNMITPEGWLVETVRSNCDLDNINLKDTERTVSAEYELEYLLLEGHCFDMTTEQPPQGLQFTLGTKSNPAVVDTIVMANLGYFQLKANPGAWILKLREGKSEDIYEIVGHEGTDSESDAGNIVIMLNTFKSKILIVQVKKKSGKIKEDILADKHENRGMWDSIKRIMMLSVLRNTKTPVKFWFLKNYLSPTFKEVIPHMAKEYGFQYELVQYKWPRWLHQQTEKQRIIWGYKILFLDVLFPLAVDKIIFVDADQIVRHDLKELRDFDLGGAPYGYTPFCDSRTEMDGYRFWKTGYWASHLVKRKYHISALYVVDLKKFRRILAGDRLRGQYQALSQDPNSLSNLDQDLPNNMIYQVAIKSLPQDWLWCETWCDDESKQRAKTIDLCNNPKTKEPKLEAAARIVPEWVKYDTEIRKLLDHLANKKSTRTREMTQQVRALLLLQRTQGQWPSAHVVGTAV